jgi:hypothetical protein
MRGAKGVVAAFIAPRKTAEAAELAQAGHAFAPAGQDFVRIGLVTHVPDQPVIGRVEHIVQGDRELHGAEVGTQVPAGLRHAVQHIGAQLVGQRLELVPRQQAQVCRTVDGFKQWVHRHLA